MLTRTAARTRRPRRLARQGLLALALCAGLASAKPVETRGTIDQVTVYRGQALVTRAVSVEAPAGLAEIVITDLPERIIPGSIYAESAGAVEVRSVRYRVRPVMQDVNEEVRQLDEEIRAISDQIKARARAGEVLAEHKGYLAKLEQFVAPAATTELSKGVLNAQTLEALTQMLLTQRKSIAEEELKLATEQRDLSEALELLNRKRTTITSGSSRSMREAVILAEVKEGRAPSLRVRYLVSNASWEPSYTVRADGDRANVLVEYYASVEQMTGEDWSGVAMTLSTATPSLVARAPSLQPLTMSLAALSTAEQQTAGYAQAKMEIARQRVDLENIRGQSRAEGGPAGDPASVDASLNQIAADELMLDLRARERVVRLSGGRSSLPSVPEEGVSVVYDLSGRTSLPSRADRQHVQIAALTMPAEFYKVATPALTSSVYDEAQATNTSALVLLSGPAAAYVQGRFVGSSDVPTVAVGESFILGFGIDSSLKASRELMERAENIQGGNRVVDLTYRMTLENFGAEPATVRILDRIPKVRDSEIKLTITASSLKPVEDASLSQAHKKSGIMRWDLLAPEQAFGPKAASFEYSIRLEHDKQMTLAGVPKP